MKDDPFEFAIDPDREFQFWEYVVSHGSALIRSPRNQGWATNVDVILIDVSYIAVPRFLGSIRLDRPTAEEIREARRLVGPGRQEFVEDHSVVIVVSGSVRHIVVAGWVRVQESTMDYCESPFDFPSRGPQTTADVWHGAGLEFLVFVGGVCRERQLSIVAFRSPEHDWDVAMTRALEMGRAQERVYSNDQGERVEWRLKAVLTIDLLGTELADGREMYSESRPATVAEREIRPADLVPEASMPTQSGV